jgi:hypothetical protein
MAPSRDHSAALAPRLLATMQQPFLHSAAAIPVAPPHLLAPAHPPLHTRAHRSCARGPQPPDACPACGTPYASPRRPRDLTACHSTPASPPGGENGFNQAIELSADMLSNVKFVQEKRLIGRFFDEISQDTGKFVFSVKDTLMCLDMGAVETLIVWESLDCDRYELLNTATGKTEVKHLTAEQGKDSGQFKDKETGAELEVQDKQPLLEWLANNYKKFGCQLEIVTNKSTEGSQFCRGFGGVGGVLRYQVNLAEFEGARGGGQRRAGRGRGSVLVPYSRLLAREAAAQQARSLRIPVQQRLSALPKPGPFPLAKPSLPPSAAPAHRRAGLGLWRALERGGGVVRAHSISCLPDETCVGLRGCIPCSRWALATPRGALGDAPAPGPARGLGTCARCARLPSSAFDPRGSCALLPPRRAGAHRPPPLPLCNERRGVVGLDDRLCLWPHVV